MSTLSKDFVGLPVIILDYGLFDEPPPVPSKPRTVKFAEPFGQKSLPIGGTVTRSAPATPVKSDDPRQRLHRRARSSVGADEKTKLTSLV